MPRNSSGVYTLPDGYLATTGQTILASQHNPPLEDIATALTGSLPRNGTCGMVANLPMGGFKVTGLANGTDPTDAVTKSQLDAVGGGVTLNGVETLTNKTLTSPVINTPTIFVNDDRFTVRDNIDVTKIMKFELSGIATGTTRTVTMPNYSFTPAALDVADQVVTGGARVTSLSLGTITSGSVTLDPGDRPLQHYTNNGAHVLAPGTNQGSILLDIVNGVSAGAITTTGWTKVTGDTFATTNGLKYRCSCSIGNNGSLLVVQAMQ